jgi:aminoglycoside phosphotransferase (APT) family kinase protein
MHPGQLTPTATVVAALVRAQFPAWSHHPVTPVRSTGTVNALFRLGPDLVVRLPLHPGDPAAQRIDLEREFAAARRLLRAGLPVATPEPCAIGEPGPGHPSPWSVWRWLPGRTTYEVDVRDDVGTAVAVAGFVRALHRVPTDGARFTGGGRGGGLRDHDDDVAAYTADAVGLVDTDAVTALWSRLRDTPHDAGFDTWTHGDLMPGNLLVAPGRLDAVIDVGGAGVADPAVDLAPAWNLFGPRARSAFREALGVDDVTWRRGMAWSLAQAIGCLAYYRVTNPTMSSTAASTLAALRSSGD